MDNNQNESQQQQKQQSSSSFTSNYDVQFNFNSWLFMIFGLCSGSAFFNMRTHSQNQKEKENEPLYTPQTLLSKLEIDFDEHQKLFNKNVFIQGFVSLPTEPIDIEGIGKDVVYIDKAEWQQKNDDCDEDEEENTRKSLENNEIWKHFKKTKINLQKSAQFYLTNSWDNAFHHQDSEQYKILVQNFESTKKNSVLNYSKSEDLINNIQSIQKQGTLKAGEQIVAYGTLSYFPGQKVAVLKKPEYFLNSKMEIINKIAQKKKQSKNSFVFCGLLSLYCLVSVNKKPQYQY